MARVIPFSNPEEQKLAALAAARADLDKALSAAMESLALLVAKQRALEKEEASVLRRLRG
jgi:hypothetical protein